MHAMTRLADRLLEMVAPHTVARATDCGYQCCYANFWRYCCYYPERHLPLRWLHHELELPALVLKPVGARRPRAAGHPVRIHQGDLCST